MADEEFTIERPFEELTDDELWKMLLSRRTSKKQRQVQLELNYRLISAQAEIGFLKENVRLCEDSLKMEREERKRLDDILIGADPARPSGSK